ERASNTGRPVYARSASGRPGQPWPHGERVLAIDFVTERTCKAEEWSAETLATRSAWRVSIGPDPPWPLGELFDRQIQLRLGPANLERWAPDAHEMQKKKEDGAVKAVLTPGG